MPRYLTTDEAAQRLGVSPSTVRDLCRRRLLPGAVRNGKAWRIPLEAVENRIQQSAANTSNSINAIGLQRTPTPQEAAAPSSASTWWERVRQHPWIFWPVTSFGILAAIISFLANLTGTGADFSAAIRQLEKWNIIAPNPTVIPTPEPLLFTPRQDGEILLVVAPFFYTEGNRVTDAHNEVLRVIQAEAQAARLKHLRVELGNRPIRADNREEAEQFGAQYNASLVVWGDDTGVRVTVNFLNRHSSPEVEAREVTISETTRTQLANPPAYARFITDDLPHQLSFLALFAIGQSYYLERDYANATTAIKQAITSVSPQSEVEGLADAYYRLGWLYQTEAHPDLVQAIGMYDKAIKLDTNYIDAYKNRAAAYHSQGELDRAIQDYNHVITLAPEDAAAHSSRGTVRFDQGDEEGAFQDFDRAIALNPKYAGAYNNRGVARNKVGDVSGALQDYNQAIALDPSDAVTYTNRGSIYYYQGDLVRAIKDFDQAIALDSTYTVGYIKRGLAYRLQGKLDDAIQDYNKAIALDPDNALAYTNRGVAYFARGDVDSAIQDYTQATTVNPKYAMAYNNRGVARDAKGDVDGAIRDFDQAIALVPTDADAFKNRGLAYTSTGNFAKAIHDFDQAIALNANDAEAYANRGDVFLMQGVLPQAIKDYSRAIALEAGHARAYYNRGQAYLRQGKRTNAIADFQQVLRFTDDVELRRQAEEKLSTLNEK
jgi:excisionase family DNA binding protein